MTGWLVYREADARYNQSYINMYIEEGIQLGIRIKLILIEELLFGIKDKEYVLLYRRQPVSLPEFVIMRARYPLLTRQLEYLGIPTFNHSMVAELCNNKAKTHQFLAQHHIPMVDTFFFQNQDFNQINEKHVIIKSVDGHGGKQVFLYEKNNHGQIKKGIADSDFIVQPYVSECREDVRIYVIGTEIICAIKRKALSGFKSNFSLGGEVSVYQLNKKETEMVTQIISLFSFGLVGIDFLIDTDGKLLLNEIEDVVGARMLYQCTDINLIRRYLLFIMERVKK